MSTSFFSAVFTGLICARTMDMVVSMIALALKWRIPIFTLK